MEEKSRSRVILEKITPMVREISNYCIIILSTEDKGTNSNVKAGNLRELNTPVIEDAVRDTILKQLIGKDTESLGPVSFVHLSPNQHAMGENIRAVLEKQTRVGIVILMTQDDIHFVVCGESVSDIQKTFKIAREIKPKNPSSVD
jgi:hypothetical protein